MSSENPFDNQTEFNCYVAVYAAYVDFNFSDDERERITSVFGCELFEKMHALYLDQSDYGSLKLILEAKDQFINTEDLKNDLLTMIRNLFSVDGDFSKLEKIQVSFFQHLL